MTEIDPNDPDTWTWEEYRVAWNAMQAAPDTTTKGELREILSAAVAGASGEGTQQ